MNPIFPQGLSPADLTAQLQRAKSYRSWAQSNCPRMVISRPWLETQLKLSGYPEKLASVVFGKREAPSCPTQGQNEPPTADAAPLS